MKCRLCNSDCTKIFSAKIMFKYDVAYFNCSRCSLIQTEFPFWLEEAYTESINSTDVGLLNRNIQFVEKVKTILYFFFDKNGKFLDYAGGYGIFTRLMRDLGFDYYWADPYTQNLFAQGFEYNKKLNIELVTTFESFEHFVNPLDEIKKILDISKNILFSTLVVPNPIPDPQNWWYYALDHGQHVSFYSRKTFEFIAKELDLNYYSCSKNLHLFTEMKINSKYFDLIYKKSKYFSSYINKKLDSKTFSDSRSVLNTIEQ